VSLADLVKEGARQFTICNACRYCEGYCAVFPAMELRRRFEQRDVIYLANLCHDCRACYDACMYVPPHEFAVNVPAVLSAVRAETYRRYAFPSFMRDIAARGFARSFLLAMVGLVAVLGVVFAFGAPSALTSTGDGSPYRVLPYAAMVVSFLALSVAVVIAFVAGGATFWRDLGASGTALADTIAPLMAARDAATLRYFGGGRRLFHHLVFYGFLADFGATVSAALLQDVFGEPPPYPILSVPVLLGSLGGIGIVVGAVGLLRRTSDRGLIVTLLLVTVTGFLTLLLRSTTLAGPSLVVHLGTVVGFFLLMPYGKFVHFVYRYAALVRYDIESRGHRS